MFKKTVLRCFMVIMLVILVSCNANPIMPQRSEAASTVTPSKPIETSTPGLESKEKKEVLPLRHVINLSLYDPSMEYLEYGKTVEFCQRYGYLPGVEFIIESKESTMGYYKYSISLTPPQYRALKSVVGDDYKGDLFIEVSTLNNSEVKGVGNITDKSGKIIWNTSFTLPPRKLTDVEGEYLIAREASQVQIVDSSIDLQNCEEIDYQLVEDIHKNGLDWSPYEIEVRAFAAYYYYFMSESRLFSVMTPPIESFGSVSFGKDVRVIGRSGELTPEVTVVSDSSFIYGIFKIPDDGWVEIQYLNDQGDWYTSLGVDVGGNWVIDLSSSPDINVDVFGLYSGNEKLSMFLALLTKDWSTEKIIDTLKW